MKSNTLLVTVLINVIYSVKSISSEDVTPKFELENQCAALPAVSDSNFKKLVGKKCYVDKTEYLYKMVHERKTQVFWFLSRPPRFGKTLLVKTIESFFKGEKKFFEGTQIYQKFPHDWPEHPVIRLDFSGVTTDGSFPEFKSSLLKLLVDAAEPHDIHLATQNVGTALIQLIMKLKKKYNKNVVVLVDEYDSPYIRMYARKKNEAPRVLATRQDFFSILKAEVDNIRYSFTTGITRLALSDCITGGYVAVDLTMAPDYAGILGFTETEIRQYFGGYIKDVAKAKSNTATDVINEMRKWYDGFRFTRKNEPLYSPISVIEYLRSNGALLKSYSGTGGFSQYFDQRLKQFPQEAIEILLSYDTEDDADELEKKQEFANEAELSGKYDFDDSTSPTGLVVFLYHSGHLSISSYDDTRSLFYLKITNLELRTDLAERLCYSLTGMNQSQVEDFGDEMVKHLANHKWLSFIAHLSRIPRHLKSYQREKIEALFQVSLFESLRHCTLKSVPWTIPVWEYSTSAGRSDIVMTIGDTVYIFDLKKDDDKENALYECEEKCLPAYLRGSAENVACFGIKFDQSGKVTSFGVAIFSRTGELHTEAGEIKLPTSFNEIEKQDVTYQVNEWTP